MRLRIPAATVWLALLAPGAGAQPLTLGEAVALSLKDHPSLHAAAARIGAAAERTRQARAAQLPRVDFAESFHTSNNPVFAFSSLLVQRRFAAANLSIGALNSPGFVNNFQSLVSAEQVVYDFGRTRSRIRESELGEQASSEQERAVHMRLVASVAAAYYGVLLAEENRTVAGAAVQSAEADLERATARRDAGVTTDADVLSVKVHLAAMRESLIGSGYDLDTAWAVLNETMGRPLDSRNQLTTALSPVTAASDAAPEFESRAPVQRPETRQALLAARMAENKVAEARSARLPEVVARGAFEADRGRFVTQGGANWIFGASLRWNVFNGGASKARVSEATHSLRAAQAQEKQTAAAVRLEVRQALAAFRAAGERIPVAAAAVEEAAESLRITRNRYEAGLSTLSDLLRTETAHRESQVRRVAAVHDQRVAAVMLELAAGSLTEASDALQ